MGSARKSGGGWRGRHWLLLVATLAACSGAVEGAPEGNADEPRGGEAGAAGRGTAGKGDRPSRPVQGTGGTASDLPEVFACGNGPGGAPDGNGGTTGAETPLGGAGNDYGGTPNCGGCIQPMLIVRCQSQSYDASAYSDDSIFDPVEACSVVRQHVPDEGAAGGAPAGGLCDSYVEKPFEHWDDGGCIASEGEKRVGECVVAGECCVVIRYEDCGV